jgi:hypothetical protein
MQNMDKELAEFYISVSERAYEEILAAAEMYGYGSDKFLEEVARIREKYGEDVKYITDEYGKMTERNIEINNKFDAGLADTYNRTFLGKIFPDYDNFG